MQLSEVFRSLGEDTFGQLIRQISVGKLKTYQLYETFKTRARVSKLNNEVLRKLAPRLWVRLSDGDGDFARDLAQAVLIAHLPMIVDVLNFLGIPNQDGFFDKNLEPAKYLSEGWQDRAYQEFHGKHPEPVLRLYLNHLAWELEKEPRMFAPAAG